MSNNTNTILIAQAENLIQLTINSISKLVPENDEQEEAKARAERTLSIWAKNTLRTAKEAFE